MKTCGASYARTGATIEQFVSSYNKCVGEANKIIISNYIYRIGNTFYSYWYEVPINAKIRNNVWWNTGETLLKYRATYNNNDSNMPGIGENYGYVMGNNYGAYTVVKPIVKLNADVKIKENGTGYKITNYPKQDA